jgi:hypothetical protein
VRPSQDLNAIALVFERLHGWHEVRVARNNHKRVLLCVADAIAVFERLSNEAGVNLLFFVLEVALGEKYFKATISCNLPDTI